MHWTDSVFVCTLSCSVGIHRSVHFSLEKLKALPQMVEVTLQYTRKYENTFESFVQVNFVFFLQSVTR